MPSTTTNLKLRYPLSSERPDGPGAFAALAGDVDSWGSSILLPVKQQFGFDAADSTSYIQAALDAAHTAGGGDVYLAPGTWIISSRLRIYSRTRLRGSKKFLTTLKTAVGATTITNGGMIYGTDLDNVELLDLLIQGVGKTGTNCYGVLFDLASAGNIQHVVLRNLRLDGFAGNGIELNTPILSGLENVRVINTTGHAIYAHDGTSLGIRECYAGAADQAGYYLKTMTYSGADHCGAETCGIGYLLEGGGNVMLKACGGETATDRSASYPGIHFQVNGGANHKLDTCYARDFTGVGTNASKGYIDVAGSASPVTVDNFRGTSSAFSPDFTYRVAANADLVIRSYSFSGLGSGLASGTPRIDNPLTQFIINSRSTATFKANRASTSNFAQVVFSTAGTDRWTIGSRNDSTEDFHFRDVANGRTIFKAGANGQATFPNGLTIPTKAGKPVDADVAGTAADGLLVANTLDKELYVRQNAHWRSTASRREKMLKLAGIISENYPREAGNGSVVITTQVTYYSAVYLHDGEVVTNICFQQPGAASVQPTNFFVGLFKSDGTRVALSNDVAATIGTGTGFRQLPLSGAYTIPDGAEGLYYLAFLCVQGSGTLPGILRSSTTGFVKIGSNFYLWAQDSVTGTTLPSPASFTAQSNAYWGCVT